jgi:5-formyltetrahydrofolate cyclo-ligase
MGNIMTLLDLKLDLRLHHKTIRAQISEQRCRQAHAEGHRFLSEKLRNVGDVASYASFGEEFDLWQLNRQLAAEGRLILPRVEGRMLGLYKVSCFASQLIRSAWGILEPDPTRTERIQIEQVACVLVPGLAFDRQHQRLGYGQGFYDRLLTAGQSHAIGIGFKEQLSDLELPHYEHDQPLNQLFLF